jgi:hypothetical protein
MVQSLPMVMPTFPLPKLGSGSTNLADRSFWYEQAEYNANNGQGGAPRPAR